MLSHILLIVSLVIGAAMIARMMDAISAGLAAVLCAESAQEWKALHARAVPWIVAFLSAISATAVAEWRGW